MNLILTDYSFFVIFDGIIHLKIYNGPDSVTKSFHIFDIISLSLIICFGCICCDNV